MPTCNLSGRPHTKLFSDCTAGQPEQKPLWRDDAAEANNPATWYHFPAPEDVMEGITLPPELQGKSLQELSLSVRPAPNTGRVGAAESLSHFFQTCARRRRFASLMWPSSAARPARRG